MTEKGTRRYIHTTLCSCPCGYVATNANERTAFTQMKIHKKVCKINCSGDNMTSIVDYSCKGLNFEIEDHKYMKLLKKKKGYLKM